MIIKMLCIILLITSNNKSITIFLVHFLSGHSFYYVVPFFIIFEKLKNKYNKCSSLKFIFIKSGKQWLASARSITNLLVTLSSVEHAHLLIDRDGRHAWYLSSTAGCASFAWF